MTFSLVGRCARTGMLGVVVSSSSPAVAARCAHVRARVGAVATQNVTDPRLGPRLLDRLASGENAEEALGALRDEPDLDYRQLLLVDAQGGTAVFTGAGALGLAAAARGPDAASAGNLLASADVPGSMIAAFGACPDAHLGDRLVAALEAGLAAGGETAPVRSAGLLVADDVAWPVADLRVDWHDDPVRELAGLWRVWLPQLDDYRARALDPAAVLPRQWPHAHGREGS